MDYPKNAVHVSEKFFVGDSLALENAHNLLRKTPAKLRLWRQENRTNIATLLSPESNHEGVWLG
jgi:hypothetical protein